MSEIVGRRTVRRFGLDIHLPGTAEIVVVVDEQAAHVRLNGVVDIGQIHALLQHLVLVHIDELFRHTRDKGGADHAKFRALASGCQELVQVIGKKLDILAGAVLQDKRDAARSADAGDRGWRETEDRPFRKLLEFLVQMRLNGLILFAPALAIIPGFQR